MVGAPVIGQRFGNYVTVSLLGEGGMGAVYLAEHPEIGRRVAIKVLRPELVKDEQLVARFLNEARAANAIRHPNIIEVLDSGRAADSTPYLVMELLEGEALAARLRRLGRMGVREALECCYQTASALSAAHAKGIVHRDLKPDNLFIVPEPTDPTRERVKVLDFGIAKLQTLSPGEALRTRTGTLMGTPVYMSPEQCLGTKAVDQRSDIYSLGVILFEMLTGRPPFLSEGFGELVNMHLNVPPPSARAANADIPEAVEALINKALAKSPEARQRSAAELQAELRQAAGAAFVLRGTSSPDLVQATLPLFQAGATAVAPGGAAGVGSGLGLRASTTFQTGSGESVAMPRPRSSRGYVVFVVALAVVVGGALVWRAMSMRAGRAGAGADPAGQGRKGLENPKGPDKNADSTTGNATGSKTPGSHHGGDGTGTRPVGRPDVRVTLGSDPSGANVVDAASGALLGVTPLSLQRPAGTPPLRVRVEGEGLIPIERDLGFEHDDSSVVTLARASRNPPANGYKKAKKPPRPRPDEPAKL